MSLQLVQNIFEQQSYNCSNNNIIIVNNDSNDDDGSNCNNNDDDNNIMIINDNNDHDYSNCINNNDDDNIIINNNISKTVFRSRLAIKYSLTNGIGLSDRFLVILSQPNTGACHRLVVPDGSS